MTMHLSHQPGNSCQEDHPQGEGPNPDPRPDSFQYTMTMRLVFTGKVFVQYL